MPRGAALVSSGGVPAVTGTCAAIAGARNTPIDRASERASVSAAAVVNAAEGRLRRTALDARATDPIQRVEPDQHVARLGTVGRSEHAGRVQLVDDACSAPVSDLEPTLKQRCRTLLILHHDFGGFAKQLVAILAVSRSVVGGRGPLERFFRANRLQHV